MAKSEKEELSGRIGELTDKIHELIFSNESLKNSIGYLNAAINELKDEIKKKK
jgi:uncharacterized small protein (DUF1192 family)